MQKKKIIYFIQLPPPNHGVAKVNDLVFNSSIINESVKKQLLEVKHSNKIEDLNKVTIAKIFRMIILAINLFFICLLKRPKYAYCTLPPTGVGFYRDVSFILIMKLLGVKPIFHLHGIRMYEALKSKWKTKLYRLVFNNSHIIHLSKGLVKKELECFNFKNTKLHYVENGLEDIKTDYPSIYSKEDINLLFLSNLMPYKGIIYLLKAFVILKKDFPNIHLHIVGESSGSITDTEISEIIAENQLEKDVNLYGAKYGREKHQHLASADIFVHPTFNDTFPLVLVEALQFGLPVVSTNIGAIPEIIKNNETGYIVESKNVNALEVAIRDLIINPEKRKAFGEKAKEVYHTNYTLAIFEENMKTLFDKL